jgi:phosphoribosylformylglycinamidine synthase
VWRIDVLPSQDRFDAHGPTVARQLRAFGLDAVKQVRASRVFLVECAADEALVHRMASDLLSDPVTERFEVYREGAGPAAPDSAGVFEVHPRPGVMDAAAASTAEALADLGISTRSVRTARRYAVFPAPVAADRRRIARLLGNDCVEEVIEGGRPADRPPVAVARPFQLRSAPILALDERGLANLSRSGHLFLSLAEMRAIQSHYRNLDREPTDLELETLAQTWSEHCVHKTLKSAVVYRGAPMPSLEPDEPPINAPAIEITYDNLLRDTIARATRELMAAGRGPQCLSVFEDNAGVIALDDHWGVAFKAETHNRPSAIEPYGGAATGVGGCIRDILGCGLGARPIADTDVFCVAPPDWTDAALPQGVLHPRMVLTGIVSGVRDYGNRMGIPTVNGAVHFDPRYLGNPLVFCGCVGLIPRSMVHKAARPGDRIVVVGGRTGRDGIHGATFSSAELTDTHNDEFSHAVQIGNAIEEKKVADVILQARDHADGCLYSAITDCGAGGLSSAVGEMTAGLGGEVDLDRIPLKYNGLRYDEIWISESQERMVLAVPPNRLDQFVTLCRAEDVEATDIGRFTDSGRLVVRFQGTIVGDMDLEFLHDGIPKASRVAEWMPASPRPHSGSVVSVSDPEAIIERLKSELSRPTVASKHWIVRQYDHEVQGRSVIKPWTGPAGDGPSNAAVLRPLLESRRGVAVGNGLCPQISDVDPYWMAVAAIDEAIRNVVSVGGDPDRIAILDNFCWGRTDVPRNMGALVRACQGCYDAAIAYGTPFISGKDSLNNEFALHADDIERVRAELTRRSAAWPTPADAIRDGRLVIPGTLLISAIAIVEDVESCVTMDLKQPRGEIHLLGAPSPNHAVRPRNGGGGWIESFSIRQAVRTHRLVAELIQRRIVCAVHDVSDGGIVGALAEMAMAGRRSCHVDATALSDREAAFEYRPSMYVVEVKAGRETEFARLSNSEPGDPIATCAAPIEAQAAEFVVHGKAGNASISNQALRDAWTRPIDW